MTGPARILIAALVGASSVLAGSGCGGAPRERARAYYRPPGPIREVSPSPAPAAPMHTRALRPCTPDDGACVTGPRRRRDEVPAREADLAALIESYRARGQTERAVRLMRVYVSRYPDSRRAQSYAQIVWRHSSPCPALSPSSAPCELN